MNQTLLFRQNFDAYVVEVSSCNTVESKSEPTKLEKKTISNQIHHTHACLQLRYASVRASRSNHSSEHLKPILHIQTILTRISNRVAALSAECIKLGNKDAGRGLGERGVLNMRPGVVSTQNAF